MMNLRSCRSCGNLIDRETNVGDGDNVVRAGDLSVCFYCGALSKFDDSLNLIPISPEEFVELNDSHPETFDLLIKVQRQIHQMHSNS